jgi:hypothetical protein
MFIVPGFPHLRESFARLIRILIFRYLVFDILLSACNMQVQAIFSYILTECLLLFSCILTLVVQSMN